MPPIVIVGQGRIPEGRLAMLVVQSDSYHTIAAAGMFEGIFREDMFEEAEGLDHPYYATKHESEKIVRSTTRGA